MRTPIVLALLASACGGSSAPAKPRPAPHQETASERFVARRDAIFQHHLEVRPGLGVELGLHDHDGKLPDVSRPALEAEVKALHVALDQLAAIPVNQLGETEQIEHAVLTAELRGQLFNRETLGQPFVSPMWYVGPLELVNYISRDYAPVADRARAVIALCQATPAYLAAAQANLPEAMPRPFLETALMQGKGLIEFAAKDVPAALTDLPEADAKALDAALATYREAVTSYDKFLADHLATSNTDFAIGEEKFLQMLADTEDVTIDLPRLEELGKADLAANLTAMQGAATALKKKTVAQALKLVLKDRPAAARVLEVATAQAADMRQFLVDQKIVTIPSEDVIEVRAAPPFQRWNFAFMSWPGPFEAKALPAFYYISPPDPSWSKAVQKSYLPATADLLFTTVHEVWPGHFLQGLHMRRSPSRILRSFGSYAMTEGWAHYAEEMMWEAGVGGGDPKVHIGELLNALLRDVRFLSAIGLHTHGMTMSESEKLFRDQAFADEGTAKQQAVRGTFDPGYLNYTLGKLMIKKLRDDWKAKLGDKFSLQAFHDKLLSYGMAPLPVIRRAMLGDDSPAL